MLAGTSRGAAAGKTVGVFSDRESHPELQRLHLRVHTHSDGKPTPQVCAAPVLSST